MSFRSCSFFIFVCIEIGCAWLAFPAAVAGEHDASESNARATASEPRSHDPFEHWHIDPQTGQLSVRMPSGELRLVSPTVANHFRQFVGAATKPPKHFDKFIAWHEGGQKKPVEIVEPPKAKPVISGPQKNPRIDIVSFRNENGGSGAGCGASLIHQSPLTGGSCRKHMITAAHCIPKNGSRPSLARLNMNVDGKNIYVTARRHNLKVTLPPNNRSLMEDYAHITFDTACSLFEDRIANLCPTTPRGIVNWGRNTRLQLKTFDDSRRASFAPKHRAGKALGTLMPTLIGRQWSVRTDVQTYGSVQYSNRSVSKGAVAPGDSGGPVLGPDGCIGGVVSQRTVTGTQHYLFSPRMVDWVRKRISNTYGTDYDTLIAQRNGSSTQENKPNYSRNISSVPPNVHTTPSVPHTSAKSLPRSEPRAQEPTQSRVEWLKKREAQNKATVHNYTYEMRYSTDNSPREYFPGNTFGDVGPKGNGKIVLVYFGPRRADLDRLAAKDDLVEARNYAYGSPEHKLRRLDIKCFTLDGLGRKITRHVDPPHSVLDRLIDGRESKLLRSYLKAKDELNELATLQSAPPERKPPTEEKIVEHSTHDGPDYRKLFSIGNTSGSHFSQLVKQNCVQCHIDKKRPFPDFISDWDKWESRLSYNEPTATTWLKKFYGETVSSDNMIANARNNSIITGHSFDSRDQNSFRSFVSKAYEKFISKQTFTLSSAKIEPNTKAIALTHPNKLEAYKNILAGIKTSDPELAQKLSDFDIIYDRDPNYGVLEAHQFPNNGTNDSYGGRPLKFSRPPRPAMQAGVINSDGQWAQPFNAGFGLSDQKIVKGKKIITKDEDVGSFFLVRLPKDSKGNTTPIATYTSGSDKPRKLYLSNKAIYEPQEYVHHSVYPGGTEFVEVLYKNLPDDNGTESYVFEVRSRKKVTRESSGGRFLSTWTPNLYRPYPTFAKFTSTIRAQPDFETNTELKNLAIWASEHTTHDSIESEMGPILKTRDGKPVSKATGWITQLPKKLSASTKKALFYDQELEPTKGNSAWALSDGVFPTNYHGGSISATVNSCNGCHSNTNTPFPELGFDHNLTAQYGNTPGTDGVISFHPYSPGRLKQFLYKKEDVRELRPELKHLYEPYDPRKHSAAKYTAFAK